ncbi:cytochrome P450 [Coniophora puteana RWD-64-598 SS2]|uniref:Cytochrome P450 n=1 Tax=Coniophora puteana (strain RWD-64-598) TaxID=741705 RepID=A0A5M3N5Q6_CONPW|nr:cytochrome P450 [Coniophora puteana RWD-64-598 SS2]EIW86404.1 cytochrome P450 [Coniophora puteana RWD-64-598 SS2]
MDFLSLSTPLLVLLGALKACGVVLLLLLARAIYWMFNMLVVAPLFDPLKNVQGPKGSILENHFRQVMDPRVSPDTHESWTRTYGKTFRFQGFGRHDYRLLSLDFRVMSHVLNSPVYEKPWQTRSLLSRLLGKGVFAMEGDEHKQLRRLIMPSFSTHAVKALTPIFFQKAEELRDIWETLIMNPDSPRDLQRGKLPPLPPPLYIPEKPLAEHIIDASHWISRATFDVIGLAGFDYHFHSLQDETEDVYLAYRRMFDIADKAPGLKGLIQLYIPWLEKILPDEGERITQESLRTIHQAGVRLIQSKKTAILAEKASSQEIKEKDILSLLIKSNLSSDAPSRLSDAELLDQLSTFLFAGSDSTSLAIAWCLHLLSLHPYAQARLRDEIMSLSPCASRTSDGPSDLSLTDAIDALPYLDAVVRETLRLCPPVHGTIRVATRDDQIPVSSPILLRDGTLIREGETIPIRKGSYVHIPIEGLNFSPDIWGEDARLFNPDRWSSLPAAARTPAHPGIASMMTFSFGPHACPGWKFSLLEAKIFIATLLPHFVFEPAAEIRKTNSILTRPYVYDQFEFGSRMPIKIGRYTP